MVRYHSGGDHIVVEDLVGCNGRRTFDKEPSMSRRVSLLDAPTYNAHPSLPKLNSQLEIRKRNKILSTLIRDPLRRPLIRLPLLQAPHILVQLGEARLAQGRSLGGSLETKMHHDIRARKTVATEELAPGFRKVVFEESAVLFQLWADESAIDLIGDA